MDKLTAVLDRITEYSVYALVFIIPFSKAGIEIFAVTAIAAWLIKKVINIRKEPLLFKHTPLNKPLLVLSAIYIISTVLSCSINESIEGLFFKFAEYIALFFICLDIFSNAQKGARRRHIFLGVITLSAGLTLIDALFQQVTGKDIVRGFEIGGLRACFATANDFAGYLIAVLPLFFCGIIMKIREAKPYVIVIVKSLYLVLFIGGLIALCVTLSRGAWAGYFLSMLFFMGVLYVCNIRVKKNYMLRIRLLAFILLPLLMFLLFFPPARQRAASLMLGPWSSVERFYRWREALLIIEDFPLFGTGPNTYTEVSAAYNIQGEGLYPHNSYLQLAAEIGITGLFAFILLIHRFFYACVKSAIAGYQRREYDNKVIFLLALSAGVLASLIQSFFDTNLYALQLVTLFWVMLGIATATGIKE